MLQITIPEQEYFDEETGSFIYVKAHTLRLEHSLVSISKWEARWHKPFLSDTPKTRAESSDYIRCMSLDGNSAFFVYDSLPQSVLDAVNKYIDDPMTATTFSETDKPSGGKAVITSEIIYYCMIAYNIPIECQKWHLNRLLTLIRICRIKNTPAKKMSKKAVMRRNRELNEARKKKYNSRG